MREREKVKDEEKQFYQVGFSTICEQKYAHASFLLGILNLVRYACLRSVFPGWPLCVRRGRRVHCLEAREATERKWETLLQLDLPRRQTGNTISMKWRVCDWARCPLEMPFSNNGLLIYCMHAQCTAAHQHIHTGLFVGYKHM